MATFEARIEGLTGVSISSSGTNPLQAQVTEFLKDGVLDVTNRWLKLNPQDVEQFQRESSAIENNGDLDLKGARIISVIREAEADGSSDGSAAWEVCTKIPASLQSKVVDPDSLYFASKYNPVYTIIASNEVHVYPTPDGTNDSFKVFYVNHVPKDQTNNAALIYSHSDIQYFPADKVYLVVIYASIQTVQAALAAGVGIDNIGIPAIPDLTSISYESAVVGDSTSPTVSTATISQADIYTGSAPTYTSQSIGLDFQQIDTYIDTEEDPELAAAKLQEVSMQLQDTNVKMQNEVNKFTKENVDYQSAIQESMQEVQIANQVNIAQAQHDLQNAIRNRDREMEKELQNAVNNMQSINLNNQNLLNKYQAEIGIYQAQVQETVQSSTTKWQQYQSLYVQLLQQYNSAFQIGQTQGGQ